jgi:putative restriction endonuclease
MKAYVAVTDKDWVRFLSDLQKRLPAMGDELDEVNFWQPGGNRLFTTIAPGELFLFKLHSPDNYIVGGGFFGHSSLLPATLAWEAFGPKNGATSFDEMHRRIAKYRRVSDERQQFTIGCILLQSPFFLERDSWIPAPTDFHPNIVQGKTYDDQSAELRRVLDALGSVSRAVRSRAEEISGPMFGEPIPLRPRLGQGTFRVLITDMYERRCAVTQERTLPTLEAAHIKSVAAGGRHRPDNGLLLRSDVHRLFDSGYVTVTPDYKFRVSTRIRKEFDNGEEYYALDGSQIWLPRDVDRRPQREALEWHADTQFVG